MSFLNNSSDVFAGGATTSQHVDAEDDDHFNNTTFKLKRTRSLGLLDNYIGPLEPHDDESKQKGKCRKEKKENDMINQENYDTQCEQKGSEGHGSEKSDDVNGINKELVSLHVTSPQLVPHDDSDVQAEPSIHVDYLSHKWDVSDISKSWRYVIHRRRDVEDSARLENASWRTWAQRRGNLKTVSPAIVNWSKDSDVTWLYGPICKDKDRELKHEQVANENKRATTAVNSVAGDLSIPNTNRGPKPILKRRTVQDMIISNSNLLKVQLAAKKLEEKQKLKQSHKNDNDEKDSSHFLRDSDMDFYDFDSLSDKLNSQYSSAKFAFSDKNIHNKNGNKIIALPGASSQSKSQNRFDTSKKNDLMLAADKTTSSSWESNSGTISPLKSSWKRPNDRSVSDEEPNDRHIHFDEQVQQCIAVDDYLDDDDNDDDDDDYDSCEGDYYLDDELESYMYEHPDNLEPNSQGHSNFNDEGSSSHDSDYDDEEGGFFLKVKSSSSAPPGLSSGFRYPNTGDNHRALREDSSEGFNSHREGKPFENADALSMNSSNSKVYKTIHPLPSTTINFGSSEESSDDDNDDDDDDDDGNLYPFTEPSRVNNKGYDYYYDYNTVYTCDNEHKLYDIHNDEKTPDVLDVPENIGLGSSVNYDAIEGRKADKKKATDGSKHLDNFGNQDSNQSEMVSTNFIENAHTSDKDSDSELDSDSDDDCLTISTRSSSQNLVQLLFRSPMSPMGSRNNQEHLPSLEDNDLQNRKYSNSISRQSNSSSSLNEQFLGKAFTAKDEESEQLARSFLGVDDSEKLKHDKYSGSQKKLNALPPETTSTHVFRENGSPTLDSQSSSLLSGSSTGHDGSTESNHSDTYNHAPSYASLSEFADRSGIGSSGDSGSAGKMSSNELEEEEKKKSSSSNNIVDQAKGLATHLLGGWKNNDS